MKKTKFITKAKRLLSGFVATAIAVSMLPTLPAMAEETTEKYPYTLFAGSSEEGAITVNAGNFCVNGNVATNGTIVSSGNMNINGTKTENAGEETIYILKKLNYAYFSGDNVDVYPDDYSYEEMNININDPMTVQGELELTGNINLNTGIKALEDVNLTGEVKNTNSSVICSETGDIVIDSTNVNLNGLVYAPYGDVEITAQNLNLNNVIIIADTITFNCPSVNANYSSSMAELVGTESDVIVELFAFGEYNAEMHSINIEWHTNYTNSDYQIWFSDDNNEYALISSVSDATTYQYDITEEFEKRYFKVTLETNYGEIVESIPFVVAKSDDGYVMQFLDSDGDGLDNFEEIICGTDDSKFDTDDDGLNDYQEIYITGTIPTDYDSVTKEVADADADSDSDGFTNIQEIEMDTNPTKADTDGDELSDYEEINVTDTDPLNPDTDSDTISDGDEIKIGLDPTNPETFGVPDAEYKIAQTISADSEALSEINISENPYKLSIDITAAGYVEGDLTAKESSYSKSIQNDSMLGIAPELIYSNSLSIDNVTLKFEISSEYVENTLNLFPDEDELAGIKRLNVFKYFEDINMLLDYLNRMMPPKYDYDGTEITSKNKECEATWDYFDEEIWPVLLEEGKAVLGQEYAAYVNWIREAYGTYGLETLWLSMDRYVDLLYYELTDPEILTKIKNQVIKGNYSDDVTLTGTAGQIAISFWGIDFIADIRDVTYDISHWEWSWSHAGQTGLDMMGILPIIGSIKNLDEFADLSKLSKVDAVDALNDSVDSIDDMLKAGKSESEILEAQKKYTSEIIEALKHKISTQIMEYLDSLPQDKVNHIINGSEKLNHVHNWEKLVPDKNWNDIKNYIVYTMINGTETISGSAYMKSMVINGYRVEVTYAKVSDTYKISDAWIRI